MKKSVSILLFTYIFTIGCFGQNQNNQWYFGYNSNINFNTTPPSSVAGNQMQTLEGSASIADKTTGALLFYSDGLTVWNANNLPMPNGTDLLGGNTAAINPGNPLSSTSAVVIVPKPFTPNIFYLVTIDQEDSTNGLRYSVVDMTLNGGLGDIVVGQKNILLFNTTSEKLQVVPNATDCGYWLLTLNSAGNTFIAFSITETGITATPVNSSVTTTQLNGRGHFKVNPQFTKIAMGNSAFSNRIIELFDFNNATGVISNPITWNYPFPFSGTDFVGVEFSPDGTKLYVSNFVRILQYNITLATPALIQASGFEITLAFPSLTLPGTLQLGPDNKIYVASNPLSVINTPNSSGASCGFQLNPIANFQGTVKYGLPQKIYSLTQNNVSNSIIASNDCAGTPISFSLQNMTGVAGIQWNFGDASSSDNTSTLLNPSHIFSATGNYTVTAVVTTSCKVYVLTRIVTIQICGGITGIKIIASPCNNLTLALQATGVTSSPFLSWNFGDPVSGANNTVTLTGASLITNPTHTFSNPGVYTVCVSFQEPSFPVSTICRTILVGFCCTGQIVFNNACSNIVPFSLAANDSIFGISWDFGDLASGSNNTSTSLNPTHTFSSNGPFIVTATVNAGCGNFTITTTVNISNSVTPTFNPIPAFCAGTTAPILPITSNNGITGTWTPAIINNTTNGTYSFTPNAGQCATNQTISTIVTPSITPTFNPIPAFCLGTTAPILPTTSNNGIVGTWSPATIDNSASGTYTFTPNSAQCATNQVITTTVNTCSNSNTILYDGNCQNTSITFSLQNTTDIVSVNWTFGEPLLGVNNLGTGLNPQHYYTGSGTYVVNAEVTTATTSYTVTENLTILSSVPLTFSFPTTYLNGATIPALPTVSANGIPGTWSPNTVDNTSSDFYTFTSTATGCYIDNVVYIDIVNFFTPTFNVLPIICTGVTPPILPNTSINGIIGTWSPNVIDNTIIGNTTYTFTPNPGQTAAVVTVNILVTNNTPTISLTSANTTANQTVCINEFITPITYNLGLPATGGSIVGLPNGVFGSVSSNVLTINGFPVESVNSPYSYTITTIGGNCGTASITGVINVSNGITPTFSPIPAFCSGTTAPILPLTSLNGITGTWSPTVVSNTNSGTYTFTPNAGQCATNQTISTIVTPSITPTFNPIPAFCSGTTAPILPITSNNGITGTWTPAIINNTVSGTYTFTPTAGQCATNQTISTIVTPSITPTFNPIPAFCSGTTAPILPITSNDGITGTWTPAIINNTVSGTYTFTPTAGQCATNQTISTIVTPSITPTFNPITAFCSGATAPILPLTSVNGITGTWSPAVVNNTTNGTYSFTPNSGQCVTNQTISIIVTPSISPTFNPIPAFCSGTIAPILPLTSLNGITGTWSPAVVSNTNSGTYTFTPNVGQCATNQTISTIVTPSITPTFNPIPAFCSRTTAPVLSIISLNGITGTWSPAVVSNTNSGTYTFTPTAGQCATNQTISTIVTPSITPTFNPITAFCSGTTAPILPLTSLNGITGTWSPVTVSNIVGGTYTFIANAGQCATTTTVNTIVINTLQPDFTDLQLCSNQTSYILNSISPNGIIGTWSPVTINFNTNGSYTFTPNVGQCATPQTINITINQQIVTSFQYVISEPFSDNPSITVIPNTLGNYLYQLDFGPQQTSNIFQNVSSGMHTVTVFDANGCSNSTTVNEIIIIKYPLFFTPNEDGYNDTWNINDLFLDRKAEIFIFDRYGKLLKQIFPFSSGWDGKYNNKDMPSTDYWFTVEYDYNNVRRIFKSHFSLKR